MSTFRKKASTPVAPAGCRVSAYNGQVLISLGVASLDDLLGGGLPVHTSLIVEEDIKSSYARLLLKYWIAQGLASCQDQQIIVVGSSLDGMGGPAETVDNLMEKESLSSTASVPKAAPTPSSGESAQDRMRIAFRYQDLKPHQSTVNDPKQSSSSEEGGEYCSTFDLTKKMVLQPKHRERLHLIDISSDGVVPTSYPEVLSQLEALLSKYASSTSTTAKPTSPPVRIALQSLGSSLWANSDNKALYSFLLGLRCILRKYNASALTTIPVFPNVHDRSRLMQAVDAGIQVQSFADSAHLAHQFPRYSGLLDVSLLPTPCSLVPASVKMSVLRGLAAGSAASGGAGGMNNNLAFRLKRKRLVIETLHLDAGEEADTGSSGKQDKAQKEKSGLTEEW